MMGVSFFSRSDLYYCVATCKIKHHILEEFKVKLAKIAKQLSSFDILKITSLKHNVHTIYLTDSDFLEHCEQVHT